jgi:membrane dipeptidase
MVGVDHVGFGSDMNDYWLDRGEPAKHGVNRNFRPRHPTVYGHGPTDALDPYPEGIHRHTLLPNLTRGLVSRGYADEEIEKILGGNYVRLLSVVRGA